MCRNPTIGMFVGDAEIERRKRRLREIPDFDDREYNPPDEYCKHNRSGYCFDCVRERHNQDMLDGKFDDLDDGQIAELNAMQPTDADFDYASAPHPSAHYNGFDPDDDPDLLENIDRFNRL